MQQAPGTFPPFDARPSDEQNPRLQNLCTSPLVDSHLELTHELRQPLSTIETLASYIALICPDDRLEPLLGQIHEMVKQANHILEKHHAA